MKRALHRDLPTGTSKPWQRLGFAGFLRPSEASSTGEVPRSAAVEKGQDVLTSAEGRIESLGMGASAVPRLLLLAACCVAARSAALTRCGWESKGAQGELVVEVFSDPLSSSSHILGFGPAEVSGALQHVTAYFTAVDLLSIQNLTLLAWINCSPLGAPLPCDQLMSGASEQSGELFMYAVDAWKGGHDNHLLVQLLDEERGVLAQGETLFQLEAVTNKTEGLFAALAASQVEGLAEGTCRGAVDVKTGECAEHGPYSAVTTLEWDRLQCSQPRAPLRVYHVSMTQWSRGRLHLWLPSTVLHAEGVQEVHDGGREGVWLDEGIDVGMARLHVDSHVPPLSDCHPMYPWSGDGAEADGREVVALLPVRVTGGSVEHLGHFFLDYLANVYRMQQAYLHNRQSRVGGMDPGADIQWLCLVDDMRSSLEDLPPRKFYPLLNAVCPQLWRSLGQLPEKACLPHAVVAFGGLETIRSKDAMSVPAAVHRDACRDVVLDLQRRVLASVHLQPRVLPRGAGKLLYLSRHDTGWRRLVNEEQLVGAWNVAQSHRSDLQMHSVHLHTMPIREQLVLLQDTRLMVGVNGGQINALFFLPEGSTHAAIFAMRWTDQNFGYVYHSWLKHRGVRYVQYDCTRGGTVNLDWLGLARYSDDWHGSMRAIRDADITMPTSEFLAFITEAIEGEGTGPYSSSDSPAELERVLLDFERKDR